MKISKIILYNEPSVSKLDLKNIENSIKVIEDSIKKYGIPAVFINCSYPKTHDWAENNFKSLSIKSYTKEYLLILIPARCLLDCLNFQP